MTKLECAVTNCLHNSEKRCCKQAIIVDGHEAKEKEETCCGSFDEKKGSMFRNIFKTPENRLEVECEAVNCVYNSDRRCVAEHIGIAGGEAKTAVQTECASFKAK